MNLLCYCDIIFFCFKDYCPEMHVYADNISRVLRNNDVWLTNVILTVRLFLPQVRSVEGGGLKVPDDLLNGSL